MSDVIDLAMMICSELIARPAPPATHQAQDSSEMKKHIANRPA